MNDRLTALNLFIRVARTGSFSSAGRDLGLSQPSASRVIAALERDIGAALFTRTTRAVTLTEAGSHYLARIEPILAALTEAEHEARGTGELRGTLRIGMSSSLGVREIIPRLPRFMQRHPSLRIELLMGDQRQDLVTDGVDVALRFGDLPDSTAMARRINDNSRIATASPAYLAERGVPAAPADLTGHTAIVGPAGNTNPWVFTRNGEDVAVRLDSRLSVTANEGAIAAAVAGLGIMACRWDGCRKELDSGALIRVLPDWDLGRIALHAVFASGKSAKPAARAFADYLIDELGKPKPQ